MLKTISVQHNLNEANYIFLELALMLHSVAHWIRLIIDGNHFFACWINNLHCRCLILYFSSVCETTAHPLTNIMMENCDCFQCILAHWSKLYSSEYLDLQFSRTYIRQVCIKSIPHLCKLLIKSFNQRSVVHTHKMVSIVIVNTFVFPPPSERISFLILFMLKFTNNSKWHAVNLLFTLTYLKFPQLLQSNYT